MSHSLMPGKSRESNSIRKGTGVTLIVASLIYAGWIVADLTVRDLWVSLPFLLANAFLIGLLFVTVYDNWNRLPLAVAAPPDLAEPYVAVLVPTYNEPPAMVRRTLESVLTQRWRHDRLVVELSTVTVTTALAALTVLVFLAWIARSAPEALTLVAIGAFAGLALDPVVLATRRALHLTRGWAAALVLLVLSVAIVTFLAVVGPQLAKQTTELPDQIPQVVDSLVDLPIIGPTLADNDVPAKIEDWLGTLPERVAGPGSDVADRSSSTRLQWPASSLAA